MDTGGLYRTILLKSLGFFGRWRTLANANPILSRWRERFDSARERHPIQIPSPFAQEAALHLRAGEPDRVDMDPLDHAMLRLERQQADRIFLVQRLR